MSDLFHNFFIVSRTRLCKGENPPPLYLGQHYCHFDRSETIRTTHSGDQHNAQQIRITGSRTDRVCLHPAILAPLRWEPLLDLPELVKRPDYGLRRPLLFSCFPRFRRADRLPISVSIFLSQSWDLIPSPPRLQIHPIRSVRGDPLFLRRSYDRVGR